MSVQSHCSDWRTSSYVIYVGLPNASNEWLLVHGYTGAYDVVDRSVVTFLHSRETQRYPKPLFGEWSDEPRATRSSSPSKETINVLRKRGYLTRYTHDEEVAFFENFARQLHDMQRQAMPSYVIMPTYDCNLRCHYCFQDHLRTNPAFRGTLKPMSMEMADRIISSLPYIEEKLHCVAPDSKRRRRVTFFGGEPLLRSSFECVNHFVTVLRAQSAVEFTAITNATELDAYSPILGPEGISKVQITIDGPAAEHDRRRIYANGEGSYERIRRNLTLALDRGVNVSVRVNVDRKNAADLPALAQQFEDEGWTRHPNFSAYLAPIHDYSPEGLASPETGSRPDFFNTWELDEMLTSLHERFPMTKSFNEVDNGLKRRVKSLLESGGSDSPRAAFCGAHLGMYIFDAFGDIYACWDRTGNRNLRIGNLGTDGVPAFTMLDQVWRSRNVASNGTCKQCRFALNCDGTPQPDRVWRSV